MKFLLRLILNRFILTLIIFFAFAIDFKFVQLNPLTYYNLGESNEVATSYYEVPLGKANVYVYVTISGDRVYLNTSNEAPVDPLITEHSPMIEWYFYLGAVALVSVIPFNLFKKQPKKKENKKK